MTLAEFALSGKVALITGAGRGIGTGIAEALADAGADLAVNARTARHLEPFARRLARRSGRTVAPLVADLTDPEQVSAMVERARAELGRIDILVNNLGDAIGRPLVGPADGPDRGVDEAHVRDLLDLNLVAAIRCTRAVGPELLARRAGKVVNISGIGGLRGRAGQSLYAAAKAGLLGFTRSLALEWAPAGVQVNAIAPGSFPDPATVGDDGYRRAAAEARERVPLGRVGRLREVGLLAVYLASSASDYMTGQVLCLDGGISA